ncbi:hypothetical protein BHM03_00042058 [Ensete ventricosum]|nr:hypothetical protein BHM03_00042058 [Ensete ventricosum]
MHHLNDTPRCIRTPTPYKSNPHFSSDTEGGAVFSRFNGARNRRGIKGIFRRLAVRSAMGSLAEADEGINHPRRRPRFLCLHGFRTSGAIMRTQVVGKWPEEVTARLDLVFPDAPFPAEGKSDVEGIFSPPYYEWFQFDKGAILSAALVGLQARVSFAYDLYFLRPVQILPGFALTTVPKVKYLIIIGGAMFQSQAVAERAYAAAIDCTSLHFLGIIPPYATLSSFIRGWVLLVFADDKSLETMHDFLQKIENDLPSDETSNDKHGILNQAYV